MARDPLSYQVRFWRAIMHSLAREADRVTEQARLLIELEPTGPAGHWLLGVGLSRQGRVDEGIASLQTAVDLSGGAALMLGWLGLILGVCGRTDEARSVLSRLEVMSRTAYAPRRALRGSIWACETWTAPSNGSIAPWMRTIS